MRPCTPTLPDDPHYAFCPAYELKDGCSIRIVFEGVARYVRTALVALTIEDVSVYATA